jgi:hypothetical protein
MAVTQTGIEFESETYQPDTGTHRFAYDPDSTSATLAVVTALSEVCDVGPLTLDPLQESVDAEALDTLLDTSVDDEEPLSVSFTASEHVVTVYSAGTVAVREGTPEPIDDVSADES